MDLIVDEEHLGPSIAQWESRTSKEKIAFLEPLHVRRLIVVAPHPDDEVLGAGGLIQQALRDGVLVEVISVTDGEASHPNSRVAVAMDLAEVRRREASLALRRLGWDQPTVTTLHLPDGNVVGHQDELDDALEAILLPDDLCVSPWRHDGHPDHDVCGEAALRASRAIGARSLGFLVWAWHWANPHASDIPWDRCRRLDLTRRMRARKRWSTEAFQSQIASLGPESGDAPILPPAVLRRFWGSYEIFVDEIAGE